MKLIEPTIEYDRQIQAYKQEFLAMGNSMDGCGPLRRFETTQDWLDFNTSMKSRETAPAHLVPSTQFIYVRESDNKVVGMLQIRHYFNDHLAKFGGHIGYSVCPSERRKGYASQMLHLALPVCRQLGIGKVLVTCLENNEGSRRTIIKNGGVYESTVHEPDENVNLQRYWIDLSKTDEDNRTLIGFWDKALQMSDEDKQGEMQNSPDSWKEMAPSEKLFKTAEALGKCGKVLDYGCGNAWAGIIAAKSGCPDVTAADVIKGGVDTAKFFADFFGVSDRLHVRLIGTDWLSSVPDETYDGMICSNVLDVVPIETSQDIIIQLARVAKKGAQVGIGLNFYMSPEKAKERGIELADGKLLYVDGVLRMVSLSDEEWAKRFAPYFEIESLEHFAWPGESVETRRLFHLRKI